MSANVENMFYYGETPWHGLGIELDHPATAKEALIAGGLDWEVELTSIYMSDYIDDGRMCDMQEIPVYQALRRKHDRRVYNIVKDRYNPIQNKQAFDLFDGVVGEGQAIYHTAGSLKDGATIFILAKLNDSIGIKGEQIDKYVCLANSHDGTSALQMFWTPIRVVCVNTLAMALSRATNKFYTKHTKRYQDRMDRAKEILGFANKFYDDWKKKAQFLAEHQLPPADMPLLLNAAFGYDVGLKMEEVYKPVQEEMVKINQLMVSGRGMDNPAIQGTKWQAYNAVAEYVDYYRIPKSKKEGARLDAAWFGSGAQIKQRTWNYLLRN